MSLIALLGSEIALAADPTPPVEGCRATANDLSQDVLDAQRALEQLDSAGFVAATDRLQQHLPCLAEPVGRHLAAEIHRTRGIRAVSERDLEADRYFAAARSIEPAYTFPNTLIPEGNPVRTAYAAFDLSSGSFAGVAPPADGSLTFDGAERLYRPMSWPTVVQHLDGTGAVAFTAYVRPGEVLPAYDEAKVVVPAPAPDGLVVAPAPPPLPPPVTGPNPRVPLALGAFATAALTGTTLGMAALAEGRFKDLDTPDDELDGLRAQANALVIVSGFTGAATAGLTIGAIVVHPPRATTP